VYAVLKQDPVAGLSISTYVLTCMLLTLALFSSGDWLKLEKPDSFSFEYNVEENQCQGSQQSVTVTRRQTEEEEEEEEEREET
jgi:hypothetical protein